MLTYSAAVTLYLGFLGFTGQIRRHPPVARCHRARGDDRRVHREASPQAVTVRFTALIVKRAGCLSERPATSPAKTSTIKQT